MGALKGKLQYMSPEQAWGRSVDARSDLFSLGAVLFEMISGRRLFAGSSEFSILEAVRAGRTDRLKEARQYIEKALKLSPDDPFILDSMGWVLFRQGQHKEGLDYLQRAFAQRPDPEIAAHVGEVLWAKGRQQEAEKLWRDSLKEHPDNDLLQGTIKRYFP